MPSLHGLPAMHREARGQSKRQVAGRLPPRTGRGELPIYHLFRLALVEVSYLVITPLPLTLAEVQDPISTPATPRYLSPHPPLSITPGAGPHTHHGPVQRGGDRCGRRGPGFSEYAAAATARLTAGWGRAFLPATGGRHRGTGRVASRPGRSGEVTQLSPLGRSGADPTRLTLTLTLTLHSNPNPTPQPGPR